MSVHSEDSDSTEHQYDYLGAHILVLHIPVERFRFEEHVEILHRIFGLDYGHPDILCRSSSIEFQPDGDPRLSFRVVAQWYQGPKPKPESVLPVFKESVEKVVHVLREKYMGSTVMVFGNVESKEDGTLM